MMGISRGHSGRGSGTSEELREVGLISSVYSARGGESRVMMKTGRLGHKQGKRD